MVAFWVGPSSKRVTKKMCERQSAGERKCVSLRYLTVEDIHVLIIGSYQISHIGKHCEENLYGTMGSSL